MILKLSKSLHEAGLYEKWVLIQYDWVTMTANQGCIIVLHLKKQSCIKNVSHITEGPIYPIHLSEIQTGKKKLGQYFATYTSYYHVSTVHIKIPLFQDLIMLLPTDVKHQQPDILYQHNIHNITDNIVYPELFFVVLAFLLLQEAAKTYRSAWRKYTPQTWPLWKPFRT